MNLFLRRALCGMALIVAAIGIAGCQHESQAEQEEVRTVSYRAVMESDKPVPEKVNTWLGAMSQEDKICQLMMISLHGSTVGQSQKDVIRKYRVSGVMLTNENLHNKNQVKAFTSDIMQTATTASMVTPYIGINRDKVLRTNESFLRLPEPNRWGQLPMERIINLVTRSAIEMRDMGFNLIVGPNANLGVPKAYLNNNDVSVFKRLITQTTANTYMLVISHVQIPAIDNEHLASNSKAIITDWLRHELGYNGVVMTDRVDVGALQANQKIGDFAVNSIVAGSDLVLLDADTGHIDEVHRALMQAVANGTISNDRLNDAVKHILLMKMQTQIQQ